MYILLVTVGIHIDAHPNAIGGLHNWPQLSNCLEWKSNKTVVKMIPNNAINISKLKYPASKAITSY